MECVCGVLKSAQFCIENGFTRPVYNVLPFSWRQGPFWTERSGCIVHAERAVCTPTNLVHKPLHVIHLLYRPLCPCTYFAITHVFALKARRFHCDSFENYADLPLTSNRTLWEARDRTEWEAEKGLEAGVNYPLPTFGELVAAREAAAWDPANASRLAMWEAGADKLGMMMNIAIELVGEFRSLNVAG